MTQNHPWVNRTDTAAARIRQMAARPDGVTTAEVMQVMSWPPERACSVLNIMTKAKLCPLFQRRVPGMKNRFFLREDLAEQWVLLMKTQSSQLLVRREQRFAAWEAEKAQRRAQHDARLAELVAKRAAEKEREAARKRAALEERKRLREAERAQARAVREKKAAAKAGPRLHALGEQVPGVLNIRGLTIKEQPGPHAQKMKAPVPADATRAVDYSRAQFTVCPSGTDTRFSVSGPVPRVVDPGECRGWAKAATS